MLPTQHQHMTDARHLLDEQTIPPVDREASEEALAAITTELEKDDGDEGVIKQQIEILRKTAPAVAEFLLNTPPSRPAKLTPQSLTQTEPAMAFDNAQALLDELDLRPVDREAVEEALAALREDTSDAKDHLAVIEHIAPGVLRALLGEG
jgi:hypothetical protein